MRRSHQVELCEFRLDLVKLLQYRLVLFVRLIECPSRLVQLQVHRAQVREFCRIGDRHVVFDRVQSAQDQIEDAHLFRRVNTRAKLLIGPSSYSAGEIPF